MFAFEQRLASLARKTAWGAAGAVLTLVGIAFLTVAAWLLLAAAQSALFAATVIGCVYLGVGAIALALSARSPHSPTANTTAQQVGDLSPLQLVAVSFLQGLEQGARARRSTK